MSPLPKILIGGKEEVSFLSVIGLESSKSRYPFWRRSSLAESSNRFKGSPFSNLSNTLCSKEFNCLELFRRRPLREGAHRILCSSGNRMWRYGWG